MASAPQTSAISFLGASVGAPRTPSAGRANSGANDGADRADGGFQAAMKQAAQRHSTQKNSGPEPAHGKHREDGSKDAAASADGKDLPPEGAALPGAQTAAHDAKDGQGADAQDTGQTDAGAAGIVLFNPLTANPAAASLAGTGKNGGAGAVVALDPDGAGGAQAGAFTETAQADGGDQGGDGEAADATASASAKSAALPSHGASAGAADKTAASDQDFSATLKQLDGAAAAPSTPGHAPPAADAGRDLATRQYQNAAGAVATVQVPVGKPGWSDAVVDKVMWMSSQQLNSAEIHLNPPDLGPLQVRIHTQHDQASVFFTSQHAAVRDALDQALPKLRDMFDSQGMQLLDSGVGGQQGSAAQQQQAWRGGGGAQTGHAGYAGDEGGVAATGGALLAARLPDSLVDAYV